MKKFCFWKKITVKLQNAHIFFSKNTENITQKCLENIDKNNNARGHNINNIQHIWAKGVQKMFAKCEVEGCGRG